LTSFNPSYAYYTFMPANLAIGQPNLFSNASGTTQSQLSSQARNVFVDPRGRVIVSDSFNNRVLIWNRIPTTNGTPADLVLGQADFVSSTINRGTGPDSNTLASPIAGIWSDGDKLLIADDGNNRVLLWNSFPTQNGQSADVVI